MRKTKSREELYQEAKEAHTSLDRRLQMLLRKAFLSQAEESR